MSYGASACYADVISEKNLKVLCPKEFQSFLDSFDSKEDYSIEQFAQEFSYGEVSCEHNDIFEKFKALQKVFQKKTKLSLTVAYHDSDNNGDCYDSLDGVYYVVDGMYSLTRAGKAMNNMVTRETFVLYG